MLSVMRARSGRTSDTPRRTGESRPAGPSAAAALALAVVVGATALAGCGSSQHRLETGYEYQPLNSTSIERRAYYADPYSIEARQAEAERRQKRSPNNPFPSE